jgi:predicted small secreted protein
MLKVIVAVAFSAMLLTGCNTVKGMGKDVSATGDAVTGTAQSTQNKL